MRDELLEREKLSRSVCLFLAEMLRTRMVSLKRASEIAERIVPKLRTASREEEFLREIGEIELDFEEVGSLKRNLATSKQTRQREKKEGLIRSFAVERIAVSPEEVSQFIKRAIDDDLDIEQLRQEFPSFGDFLSRLEKEQIENEQNEIESQNQALANKQNPKAQTNEIFESDEVSLGWRHILENPKQHPHGNHFRALEHFAERSKLGNEGGDPGEQNG